MTQPGVWGGGGGGEEEGEEEGEGRSVGDSGQPCGQPLEEINISSSRYFNRFQPGTKRFPDGRSRPKDDASWAGVSWPASAPTWLHPRASRPG